MSKELTGNRKGNTMAKCGTPKKMMMGGPAATTTSRRAIPTPAPMPARPVPGAPVGGVTAVRAPTPGLYAPVSGGTMAAIGSPAAMQQQQANSAMLGKSMAMKKGGKIDGMAKRGKTKGKMR